MTAVGTDAGPTAAIERYPGRRFAGLVVTNYLWRPMFSHLVDALSPGGVLLYETFAVGHAAYGKPARPECLLRAGELLDLVRDRLQVVAYEHGCVAEPLPSVRPRFGAANAAEPLELSPKP